MEASNEQTTPIIEGIPGEKKWSLIARSIRERAALGSDLTLRIEINGKVKEVTITAQSTQQTVSEELNK